VSIKQYNVHTKDLGGLLSDPKKNK